MTRASGKCVLTASAFAAANASAVPDGVVPERRRSRLIGVSSTSAGTTSKDNAAASSIRRRKGLADASTSRGRTGSTIAVLPRVVHAGPRLLAVVQQPDDGRRRLLDGAARHVDHGPAVPGAEP